MTVSDWIDEFLIGYKPTVKGHTYRNTEHDLEVIREEIGGLKMREVEPSDIKRIVAKRAGMAESYIKKLKTNAGQLLMLPWMTISFHIARACVLRCHAVR